MKRSVLLICYLISGVAALSYEILWQKELSLVFGSTSYSMSTVVSSFMAGLAIGSVMGGTWLKKCNNVRLFGFLQVGIGVSGVLLNVVIQKLSPVFALLYYSTKGMPSLFLALQFAVLFLILLIPTIMMGMTLPAAISIYVTQEKTVSEEVGVLYAFNTIGCVIGSMAAGFLTIPLFGLKQTIYIAANCNFLAAALTLKGIKLKSIVAIGFVLASIINFAIPATDYFFNIYHAGRIPSYEIFKIAREQFDVVWRKDNSEGTVVITKGRNVDRYTLTISGKPEGGTPNPKSNPNPELMAYLPLAYRPNAQNFLKIGLGSGETLMTAGKTKSLASLDVIEINQSVIDAAQRFFYPDLYKDPRINFIVSDARQYLTLNNKKYDIISSQATDPTDASSGFLFTREYFEIIKSRLTDNGIYGMFLPIYLLDEKGSDIVVKTFASVFPYCYSWRVWGNPFLIASMKPLEESPEFVMSKIEQYGKGKSAPLEYISGHEKLKAFVRNSKAEINTDDRPVVEYIAAKGLLKLGT